MNSNSCSEHWFTGELDRLAESASRRRRRNLALAVTVLGVVMGSSYALLGTPRGVTPQGVTPPAEAPRFSRLESVTEASEYPLEELVRMARDESANDEARQSGQLYCCQLTKACLNDIKRIEGHVEIVAAAESALGGVTTFVTPTPREPLQIMVKLVGDPGNLGLRKDLKKSLCSAIAAIRQVAGSQTVFLATGALSSLSDLDTLCRIMGR